MSSIITSDYSTPRTTRTPRSVRSRGKKRKIAHLIYRPLELDTESSSESNENNFRRKKMKQMLSRSRSTTPNNNLINLDTPAIEYNPSSSLTPTTIPNVTPEVETITISSESTQTTTITVEPNIASLKSIAIENEPVVNNSEPPTPPVTPEKVKEEISSFVPGNIWIFKTS